jgi:hypothetical protein
MTKSDAIKIVAGHCARLKLPARLDGVRVLITDYQDEQILRFIKPEEPEITLATQRMLNEVFAGEIRRRGGNVQFVSVSTDDYFAWLGKFDLKDGPSRRAQFVSWLTCPEPKFTPQK